MKRKQLSKKNIKEINNQLFADYGLNEFIAKKEDVYTVEAEFLIIYVNSEAVFFYHDNKLVPTLKLILKNNFLKKVVIDMPAVKFIANGADVMRPGIKEVDDGILESTFVAIVDENNKKPLAIGISKLSSEELRAADSGKVIKNIHYVGDVIWNS